MGNSDKGRGWVGVLRTCEGRRSAGATGLNVERVGGCLEATSTSAIIACVHAAGYVFLGQVGVEAPKPGPGVMADEGPARPILEVPSTSDWDEPRRLLWPPRFDSLSPSWSLRQKSMPAPQRGGLHIKTRLRHLLLLLVADEHVLLMECAVATRVGTGKARRLVDELMASVGYPLQRTWLLAGIKHP